MPTQQEYNIVKQQGRQIYSKIIILDYQFNEVGNLDGVVIDNPTFTNNSNSTIRRTCSIKIYPTDSSFDLKDSSGKLWIDKYIQVYLGIYDNINQEIVYSNMGLYLLNSPSQTYNATTNTISFNGNDLMAKMTGLRGGNLEGLSYYIPQGTNVNDLLVDTIALFGFTEYEMVEYPIVTPYDITIDAGGTGYDIISQVLNILPNYQAYFDVDGVFHFDMIPSGEDETVQVDDDIWQDVLISYSRTYEEDDIKNYIEVLGKEHESTVACDEVTISDDTYVTTASDISELADGLQFSFTTPSDEVLDVPYININSTGAKEILVADGSVPTLELDTYYVIEYVEDDDYYKFLSSVQPYGVAYEDNEESPFYIDGTVGILRIVLSGSDYDDINSDYLAQERANFELYQRCRLQDSVTIQCVPIYWLDTNWLVEITLPNKNSTEETNQYLIKSINTTFGVNGTQSITLMRYYPYYPST